MHITAYKDNNNIYKVVITIVGGVKDVCTILNPDSTKVNSDYRRVLQYIITSFYNNKVRDNLVGAGINESDPFSETEAYWSKYCFADASCMIVKVLDGYVMKIKYGQNMNKEQADQYFNTLFNAIYHSLWNVFVWYKDTSKDVFDEKSTKIVFTLDSDHIYTSNIHRIVLQRNSSKREILAGKISITIK